MKRCRYSSVLSSKKNEEVLIHFPEELLIEIFEWLPARSVVRFRCLTKSWSDIFKRPTFTENQRRKQGSKGIMLLVRRRLPPSECDGNDDVLSFRNLDSPATEVRPSLSITFLKDQVGLEKSAHTVVNLAGHCNGIVYIMYGRHHILCNPPLREFKPLPPFSFYLPDNRKGRCIAQGFGVANDNDFKVILMHKIYDKTSNIVDKIMNKSYVVMVHLYSSRTNSWRRLDDAPVLPVVRYIEDYVLINGACHWLGRTFAHNHKTILCFDIEFEVFRQLELPDCLCQLDIADAIPTVLNDGCLGLLQCQEWFSTPEPIEVWGMKEYGFKESWTKMFVLNPQPLAKTLLPWKNEILMVHEPILGIPREEYIRLQGLELDEKFNCQLASISLNTNTNEIKKFPLCGAARTMCMLMYEESLISVN